jgi:hypothetical protein
MRQPHLWLLSWLLLSEPDHAVLPVAAQHHLTAGALTGLRQLPAAAAAQTKKGSSQQR